MFLFGMAKANLLAQFKARFNFNPDGQDYIFYPDPRSDGFLCTQAQYETFVSDFKKTIKWGTRILWLSLLIIIPLLIYIQLETEFEWTIWTTAPFFVMPLPFVFARGYRSYMAPDHFFEKQRFTGKTDRVRSPKEKKRNVMDTRIKGMSWPMLILMPIVGVAGTAKYLLEAEAVDYKLVGILLLFALVFFFGCYLIVKKVKIRRDEYKGRNS